jgi:Uma2 family endonuclease
MSQAARSPGPRRFTREEYDALVEQGFFRDEQVELLDGAIVTMSPENSRHAATVHRLLKRLFAALGDALEIRIQSPIGLDGRSEPEPDVALCARVPDSYEAAHPAAKDVLLAIEVAESSLAYDRGSKAAAYARNGIPSCWIVNLLDRRIEALTEPDAASALYRKTEIRTGNDSLLLPGGASIRVSDVLK